MSLTWSIGASLNAIRAQHGGSGDLGSAIVAGGNSNYNRIATTEAFNGRVWSSSGDLNNPRELNTCGGSQSAAICMGGFDDVSPHEVATSEIFSGAAWSNSASLNTARDSMAGGGSPSAAICMGGSVYEVLAKTETFNGTSWSNKANLNHARQLNAGGGSPTAAITMGGAYASPWVEVLVSETYNGTSWTDRASINTGRDELAGGGSPSDAVCMGGMDHTYVYLTTETFNGSAWTDVADLNVARFFLAGGGSSTDTISMGGAYNGCLDVTEIAGCLSHYSASIRSQSSLISIWENMLEAAASINSLSSISANYIWRAEGENSATIGSVSAVASQLGEVMSEAAALCTSVSSIDAYIASLTHAIPPVADGLYLIQRSIAPAPGVPKLSKHVKGYNDHYLDFLLKGRHIHGSWSYYEVSYPVNRYSWEDWPHYKYVQEDSAFGLILHFLGNHVNEYVQDVFSFTAPTLEGDEVPANITKITAWAFIIGKGQVYSYQDYDLGDHEFGETQVSNNGDFENYTCGWVSVSRKTKCYGEPWTWPELAAFINSQSIRVGAMLRLLNDWYFDFQIEGSRVRHVKLVIDYINQTGKARQITLWPTGDFSLAVSPAGGPQEPPIFKLLLPECRSPFILPKGLNDLWTTPTVLKFYHNIDWKVVITDEDFCIGPVLPALDYPTHYSNPAYLWCNIPDLPGTLIFNKVTVECDSFLIACYGGATKCTPFLLIGGIKYYGTEISPPAQPSSTHISYTWSINPATSAPWTYSDLAALKYGFRVAMSSISLNDPHSNYNGDKRIGTPIVIVGPKISMYLDSALQFSSRHGSYEQTRYGWTCDHAWSDYVLPALVAKLDRNDGTSLIKRYGSDLSEVPANNADIDSLTDNASFWGFGDPNHVKYRMYLRFNGQFYYDAAARPFNNDPLLKQDVSHIWSVSPATGLKWTYEELQGLEYGIEVSADDAYDTYTMELLDLNADFSYWEFDFPLVKYLPIDAYIVGQTKYAQNPNIRADDFNFVLPPGTFLPERTEIAFVKSGEMVFHGLVYSATEISQSSKTAVKTVQVLAKSQQIMLTYRDIPYFFYHADINNADSFYTLDKLFSDEMPTYPFYQCWDKFAIPSDWWYSTYIARPQMGCAELLKNIDTGMGLFFLINSWVPNVNDGTKLLGLKPFIQNRAKIITHHDPVINNHAVYYPNTLEFGSWGLANHGVRTPDCTGWEPGTVFTTDPIGGIRRLKLGDPLNLAVDEFAYSGDDVLVHSWPGSSLIFAYHAFDTHLRPGIIENGSSYVSSAYLFRNNASLAFDDFFTLLGYEIQFRNDFDGNVYMDAGSEVSRDTGRAFLHNVDNVFITKKIPINPAPNRIIGIAQIPEAISPYERCPTAWLDEVINNPSLSGLELKSYLSQEFEDDKIQYEIHTLDEEWLLRPGDKIWVKPYKEGIRQVRVQQVTILKGESMILAGKRYLSLNKQWGAWKKARSVITAEDNLLNSAFAGDAPTVYPLYRMWWPPGRLMLNISVQLWVAEGQTAPAPAQNMFLLVSLYLDGVYKPLPPGRIYVSDNSAISLDLSDYRYLLNESYSIQVRLVNGIVPDKRYGHKISGKIAIYSRSKTFLG